MEDRPVIGIAKKSDMNRAKKPGEKSVLSAYNNNVRGFYKGNWADFCLPCFCLTFFAIPINILTYTMLEVMAGLGCRSHQGMHRLMIEAGQ